MMFPSITSICRGKIKSFPCSLDTVMWFWSRQEHQKAAHAEPHCVLATSANEVYRIHQGMRSSVHQGSQDLHWHCWLPRMLAAVLNHDLQTMTVILMTAFTMTTRTTTTTMTMKMIVVMVMVIVMMVMVMMMVMMMMMMAMAMATAMAMAMNDECECECKRESESESEVTRIL